MKFAILFLSLLLAGFANAESEVTYQRTGLVNTSISATSQDGFECANSAGKYYLISELPEFFSTEFGKVGLLRQKHIGQYKLVLVIDENAVITGYQLATNTNKNSLLVQTILNLGQLPALNSSNLCIVGKPFIFEFTIE